MEAHCCPRCKAPLAPFNLRANDPVAQIVFANTTIEPGLDHVGLRCTRNPLHEFGLKKDRLVEISPKVSRTERVPHPNPNFREWAADRTAGMVLHWLHWAPFPQRFWNFLHGKLLWPWQVAEAWYVVYDPDAEVLSPEEEARVRADIEADRFGEDLEPPAEDPLWVGDDGNWDDDDDDWGDEGWAEHLADEEDRDHDTDFSDDDDDWGYPEWEDDSDDWDDDLFADEEPEPVEEEDTDQ